MKKLFPAIVLCLFLFSCMKYKDSATSISIVGTWTVTSSTISYYDKNDKLIGSEDTGDDKVTFNSNGSVTGTSIDDDETTTYTVNSSNGKKYLKITTDDRHGNVNSTTYEVIILTDHNLEFKSDNLYDGVPDTYNDVFYTKVIVDLKASR
jgi:hypothetical protein